MGHLRNSPWGLCCGCGFGSTWLAFLSASVSSPVTDVRTASYTFYEGLQPGHFGILRSDWTHLLDWWTYKVSNRVAVVCRFNHVSSWYAEGRWMHPHGIHFQSVLQAAGLPPPKGGLGTGPEALNTTKQQIKPVRDLDAEHLVLIYNFILVYRFDIGIQNIQ